MKMGHLTYDSLRDYTGMKRVLTLTLIAEHTSFSLLLVLKVMFFVLCIEYIHTTFSRHAPNPNFLVLMALVLVLPYY